MSDSSTLVLTRSDVASLLSLDDCIAGVEEAFRAHAEGRTLPPAVLGVPAPRGAFHAKAAGLLAPRPRFAAKVNANFPDNPAQRGRPAIQGAIVLCDAEHGAVLALMDSIEITIQRTGAATAVAARRLARQDARSATVCGCGDQGRVQLRAISRVRRLERAWAFDREPERARRFARDMAEELRIAVEAVDDLSAAVRRSDICLTCTPSRRAYLERSMVPPGCFVAAVGADSPGKQELDPALLAASTVVVDVLEQAATMGDLHHALDQGVMKRADVHAELAEVVSGRKPGRRSADEITVFDSTGTALQDVAAAALVYERAVAAGRGLAVDLGR